MTEHVVNGPEEASDSHDIRSLLSSPDKDYLVRNSGDQVPVSDIIGKNILLYFSAHWCPPCRAFTPKLVEVYHKIKSNDNTFELIFISGDRDQASFDDYFSQMPWLALPFGLSDTKMKSLGGLFNVRTIPKLVAIGPTGKTVSTEARELVMLHGADAYPFTEHRLKEVEEEYKEMAKGWPEKVKHELHDAHELVLSRCRTYKCDKCDEEGKVWRYSCRECNYDLHPKCALEEEKIRSYAPDLARSLAGLILSSNDLNFQGECLSLLRLQPQDIESEIVENCIKEKLISVIDISDRKPQRNKEAAPYLFYDDCYQEPNILDEYEESDEANSLFYL